jgi:single-strand DNA-binding protein
LAFFAIASALFMARKVLLMSNFVMLVGRLGQDPEIKTFESGSVKARFSVAVDRSVGKDNKQTDWFAVEVWGQRADFVGEYVKKGQLVSVYGSLEVQRWTDNTGNTREAPIIRCTDLRLEGSRRDNEAPMMGAAPSA